MSMSPELIEATAEGIISSHKGPQLGPWLMGFLTSSLFFGIIINQTIRWIPHSHKDWLHVRVVIWTGLLIHLGLEISDWTFASHLFVYNYGRYTQFFSNDWSSMYAIFGILSILPVRLFFAERAYLITNRSKVLLGVITCLILTDLTASTCLTVYCHRLLPLQRSKVVKALSHTCPVICIVIDSIITTSIAISLYRSRTGWSHTDAFLKKVIILTIESSVPGTFMALIYFLHGLFNTNEQMRIWFMLTLGKPYMIGALAVLNWRHTYSKEQENTGSGIFLSGLNKGSLSMSDSMAKIDSKDERVIAQSSCQTASTETIKTPRALSPNDGFSINRGGPEYQKDFDKKSFGEGEDDDNIDLLSFLDRERARR